MVPFGGLAGCRVEVGGMAVIEVKSTVQKLAVTVRGTQGNTYKLSVWGMFNLAYSGP